MGGGKPQLPHHYVGSCHRSRCAPVQGPSVFSSFDLKLIGLNGHSFLLRIFCDCTPAFQILLQMWAFWLRTCATGSGTSTSNPTTTILTVQCFNGSKQQNYSFLFGHKSCTHCFLVPFVLSRCAAYTASLRPGGIVIVLLPQGTHYEWALEMSKTLKNVAPGKSLLSSWYCLSLLVGNYWARLTFFLTPHLRRRRNRIHLFTIAMFWQALWWQPFLQRFGFPEKPTARREKWRKEQGRRPCREENGIAW